MTWTVRLSKDAAKQLRGLPKDRQRQILQALDEMADDPYRGDVIRIQSGRFKGVLRKRVGRLRIICSVDPRQKVVAVAAILQRSEGTYR